MKTETKWGLAAAGAALSAGLWLYQENTSVEVEPLPVALSGLPAAFRGFKIAVVSDVHLPRGGVSSARLSRLVALQRPDVIVLPGDLTNSYADFDREGLTDLGRRLAAVAPCYAVAGNHELRFGRTGEYARLLERAGVRVLRDGWTLLEREGETLTLYGMERKRPRPLPASCPRPVIALAHQPQWLYLYEAAGWDLVISGHAHGGQVRLIGQGLYAPGQGMLPPFTSGLYRRGNTQMAVSRGLGNSTCASATGCTCRCWCSGKGEAGGVPPYLKDR